MGVYLVVKNDVVENTIIWDGVSPYTPPDGCTLVEQPGGVGIGWILVNGVWEPPPPPPPQPVTIVTMRQARLALLDNDLLDEVDAEVAGRDRATRISWEFASVIERDNPTVISILTAVGLDDAQIDDLFTQASKL